MSSGVRRKSQSFQHELDDISPVKAKRAAGIERRDEREALSGVTNQPHTHMQSYPYTYMHTYMIPRHSRA